MKWRQIDSIIHPIHILRYIYFEKVKFCEYPFVSVLVYGWHQLGSYKLWKNIFRSM